jgi:hypothetical protein
MRTDVLRFDVDRGIHREQGGVVALGGRWKLTPLGIDSVGEEAAGDEAAGDEAAGEEAASEEAAQR